MITRKTKVLENLVSRLKALDKASVASGYFPEAGIHQGSGMHYAELMDLHEYGSYREGEASIPPRPVREYTMRFLSSNPNVWTETVSRYLREKESLQNSLGKIGAAATINAQSIFGTGQLTPNKRSTVKLKGRDEPLVDSGDLRDAWTWKISLTSDDF